MKKWNCYEGLLQVSLDGRLSRVYDASCWIFRRRPMVDRTVTADAVLRLYAPPAMTLRQDLHDQMPVAVRFTLSFPQKLQRYVECCDTSTLRRSFLRVAPYRVPYFPVIPTFFVRCLPILN